MNKTVVASITARGAGANMSVDVDAGARHNLSVPTADPTRPRVDRIVSDGTTPQLITGVPTTGANLQNRLGIAPLPPDHMDVGCVLVPAGCSCVWVAQEAWIDARIAEIERDIRGD